MFSEQYATEKALRALGITPSKPLSKLPRINEIIPPNIKIPLSPLKEIEMAGMPKAGKTTTVSFLEQAGFPALYFYDLGSKAKKWVADYAPEEFDYFLVNIIKQGLLAKVFLQSPAPESGTIIFDQGELDILPFVRADFISGRIGGEKFWNFSRFLSLPLGFTEGQVKSQKAFILCLTPPETSLQREGPRSKPGRYMNPDFLEILLEQYLRLHYELLSGPRPFYYCCLDFTPPSLAENQELLKKTLENIFNQD